MITYFFRLGLIAQLVIPLLTGEACTQPQDTSTLISAKFAQDIQPLFNEKCVACHNLSSFSGGLDLSPEVAHKNLVNKKSDQTIRKYVIPGSPETSYLISKITKWFENLGGGGVRMPRGGPYLTDTQIGQVRQWIAQGALEN